MHWLGLVTPLDPLHGDGYQWWSGLGADVFIFTGVAYLVRKHNCEVHKCWRVGRHQVAGTEHRTCRRHHPHGHLTAEQVLKDHEAAK